MWGQQATRQQIPPYNAAISAPLLLITHHGHLKYKKSHTPSDCHDILEHSVFIYVQLVTLARIQDYAAYTPNSLLYSYMLSSAPPAIEAIRGSMQL